MAGSSPAMSWAMRPMRVPMPVAVTTPRPCVELAVTPLGRQATTHDRGNGPMAMTLTGMTHIGQLNNVQSINEDQ